MTYKVTVIIPVYNVVQYIERCAQSLLCQSLREVEFIFVDDCSTDDSIVLLERVIRSFPNREKDVKIIKHKDNVGLWKCRSDGLQAATGEFVIHCDSDDWVDYDMYENLYCEAQKSNAEIVICGYYEEYAAGPKIVTYPYEIETLKELNKYGSIFPSVCNKLIKRKLYVDNNTDWVPGINVWEDLCVSIPLRLHSRKTVILNKPFYHYRKSSNSLSLTSTEDSVIERIKSVQFIEKYITEKGLNHQLSLFISELKLICKNYYLTKTTIDGYGWYKLFPEINKSIWKKESRLKNKFIYWCLGRRLFIFPRLYYTLLSHIQK